jgi:hypothetical protein
MYIKNKNQFEVLFLHKHEILTFEYAHSQKVRLQYLFDWSFLDA